MTEKGIMKNNWEKYINKKFGRLTVISRTPWYRDPKKRRNRLYKVRCDCGNEKALYFAIANLKSGHRKSCGCLKKELDKNKSPYLRYMRDNGMKV